MSTVESGQLRRDLGLAAWQVRYEQRAFWRNRAPRLLRVPDADHVPRHLRLDLRQGHDLDRAATSPTTTSSCPGILAYGVIATTFVNMAISTAILRDSGVLKRMQGTPLPRWAYVAGRIGSAILTTLTMAVLTLLIGRLAYNVHVRGSTFAGLVDRAGARDRLLHHARHRHRALHPQRRGRPGRAQRR